MARPNFRMIRLAREMRTMSQAALAEHSGVPQAIISRIESDVRAATSLEVERIGDALGYPLTFFYEPDVPGAAPLFRKRAIRSVVKNRMIQARVNTAVLAARRILDAGIEIDTPYALPDRGEIPSDDPVEASAILRRAWHLPNGRIDDVTAVIESAGGIVLHVDFGTDDASAAFVSTLGDDARVWFLVNTRELAGDRVRLSLAHELGHAVMHRHLPVHDERKREPEAYEFATALLLPPEDFNQHVHPGLTLQRARDLKRAYWVSVQAIVKAAGDRQLIPPARYASLYKQISARGWRRTEPDPIPVELPAIWPGALDVHRSRHGYSDDDLARIARLSADDLRELFPTSFGTKLRVLPGGNTHGSPRGFTTRADPAGSAS
jgi:Zn-dependent peptidase ImmA (M78 family)/transcriptional regulator with XRE-family HTH domain